MITGWTTCLTYETTSRLGFEHFDHLLDEMAEHGMRRLTVMTASHYHFDLVNHGIAWPVRNRRLEPLVDRRAVNAEPRTEFLSRLLPKAHRLGIEVFFEVKYAGMEGIEESYPGIQVWTARDGRSHADHADVGHDAERDVKRRRLRLGHICHDCDIAQRFMTDQLTDLLEFYPEVDGIVMEWPGYPGEGCYCASSRAAFLRDTGTELRDAPESARLDWQNGRVRDVLRELSRLVRRDRPSRAFGLYTGFSPADRDIGRSQDHRGHRIDTLTRAGIDFAMPYCEGRHREREEQEIVRVMDYLSPLPCYVHCVVRRTPPAGYPLPPADPAYIRRIVRGLLEHGRTMGGRFVGMSFFNEVKIPAENRAAVYEAITGA
jgi:hypothetical protein